MNGKKERGEFDVDDFVRRVAAFVRANPDIAARAYAAAAHRIRREAGRPENIVRTFHLQDIALKLDQLAAQEIVPQTDIDSAEVIATYLDNPRSSVQTDYEALVEDIAASKVAPDGSPNDEGTAQAMLDRLQEDRDHAEAPPVQVTPLSAKPYRTMFGNNALVQYGNPEAASAASQFGSTVPGAASEAQVVRWDGRVQETQAVTVSVARIGGGSGATFPQSTDPSTSLKRVYRPYFRVNWGGDRGQVFEAVGDVGRGCQFTIPCNFLYVAVGMDAPTVTSILPYPYTSGSMVLGASMGFYTTSRQSKVYRTVYVDNLAGNGATQTVTIPLFAQTVECVIGQNTPNFAFQVQAANGDNLGSLNVTGIQASGNATALSGDAYQIVVTNNNATAQSVEIVFGLSL